MNASLVVGKNNAEQVLELATALAEEVPATEDWTVVFAMKARNMLINGCTTEEVRVVLRGMNGLADFGPSDH